MSQQAPMKQALILISAEEEEQQRPQLLLSLATHDKQRQESPPPRGRSARVTRRVVWVIQNGKTQPALLRVANPGPDRFQPLTLRPAATVI